MAKDGVLDKFEDSEYPEFMFVNEVLGLPEGTGVQPVSIEDLYRMCADYDMIYPDKIDYQYQGLQTYGTIDWAFNTKNTGLSYTIYAIWSIHTSKIQLLFCKRQIGKYFSDPDLALDDMTKSFYAFNTAVVLTDYGVGHKENIRLRSKLVSRNIMVKEVMYTGNNEVPRYNLSEDRYEVGRTESLDMTFSGFSRMRYMFPRKEQCKQYLSDIMNVYVEFDPTTRKKKYDHAGTGPDDFLHLCNYVRVLLSLLKKKPI